MNEDNLNPLSKKEYDSVGEAVFSTINNCPELPIDISLDYQKLDGIGHIGLLTVPGGKILRKYVTGGFEAQLPFQLLYKCAPTANGQYLDAEKLVDSIADYLSEQKPLLSGGRETEEITMDSITYRSKAEQDGSIVFMRNGAIKYEKE